MFRIQSGFGPDPDTTSRQRPDPDPIPASFIIIKFVMCIAFAVPKIIRLRTVMYQFLLTNNYLLLRSRTIFSAPAPTFE